MELVSEFLEQLGEEISDESAYSALCQVNSTFVMRLQYQNREELNQELVDLYDAAINFDVIWPDPIGRYTAEALQMTNRMRKSNDLRLKPIVIQL